MTKKLTKDEYKRLKDYLSRANYALSRITEICPELEHFTVPLKDGRQLSLSELFSWVNAARSECWKYGPPEVRRRRLEEVMKQQPEG